MKQLGTKIAFWKVSPPSPVEITPSIEYVFSLASCIEENKQAHSSYSCVKLQYMHSNCTPKSQQISDENISAQSSELTIIESASLSTLKHAHIQLQVASIERITVTN